jgi:tagatose 1,6-diphosphate aldolase/sulfofructosephosphate aldolase
MTHATKARTGTLDDIATDSHVFSIIAMDQRNTLRRMFTAVGLDASDDHLRTAKADVARVLTPAATGLLSDPTYGVPAITEANALAPNCGLLIAAEPSERRSYQGEPRTDRDPALDAQWVLDQGGDALKFFVQLRADRPAPGPGEPDLVAETLAVCAEIIRDCRDTGVPVVIENLVYARPGEDLRGQAREDAIIEAAKALNDLDIDLLKLEYPGSPEGARRLASILGRPWAVLSAGVPFDQFTDIIRIAADEGGASGFIAGRSVWREEVSLVGHQREEFLTSVALPRLERLVEVAAHRARPWTEVSRRAYPSG